MRHAIFRIGLPALLVVAAASSFTILHRGNAVLPVPSAPAYRWLKAWPQLPDSLTLGQPSGMDMDREGSLVVFCRRGRTWPPVGMPDTYIQLNTVLFIDPESGKLVKSWGGNRFVMPHGLTVDPDNNIWLTDVGLHQVFKFTHDGKLIMALGQQRIPGNDSAHFDMPTAVAIAGNGSFYVSDGYGNSRVIQFTKEGRFVREWGRKGSAKGEFNTPHGISLDKAGNVYVADRENSRIQVFTATGTFLREIADPSFGHICDVDMDGRTGRPVAVDDLTSFKIKHLGSDVLVFDKDNAVEARCGRTSGYDGATTWYHDLCTDAMGNIYVGDILGSTIQKFEPVRAKGDAKGRP